MAKREKDIVTVAPAEVRIVPDVVAQVTELRGAYAPGENLQLPRVKTPVSANANFMITDIGGETALTSFVAVVLAHRQTRAYWPEIGGNKGIPPTCSSLDAHTGHENTETGLAPHDCATCPRQQFGTGRDATGRATRGQACKRMVQMVILRPGSALPELISCPPTSVQSYQKYITILAANRLNIGQVWTVFGIGPRVGQYQVPTIELKAEMGADKRVRRLTEEEAAAVGSLMSQIEEMFVARRIALTSEDYAVDGGPVAAPQGAGAPVEVVEPEVEGAM